MTRVPGSRATPGFLPDGQTVDLSLLSRHAEINTARSMMAAQCHSR
jgi:hypothetical protein